MENVLPYDNPFLEKSNPRRETEDKEKEKTNWGCAKLSSSWVI